MWIPGNFLFVTEHQCLEGSFELIPVCTYTCIFCPHWVTIFPSLKCNIACWQSCHHFKYWVYNVLQLFLHRFYPSCLCTCIGSQVQWPTDPQPHPQLLPVLARWDWIMSKDWIRVKKLKKITWQGSPGFLGAVWTHTVLQNQSGQWQSQACGWGPCTPA